MVFVLIIIVLGAIALFYTLSQPSEDRQLTAEEVVDLEVQAQQEFEQAGGQYE